LQRELDTRNVLNAKDGFRKNKDVITLHVIANITFVIDVVGTIPDATARMPN
jgi:hypothetical protein